MNISVAIKQTASPLTLNSKLRTDSLLTAPPLTLNSKPPTPNYSLLTAYGQKLWPVACLTLSLVLVQPAVWAQVSQPVLNKQPKPEEEDVNPLSDWTDTINGQLDTIEELVGDYTEGFGSLLGGVVEGIGGDTSGVGNLLTDLTGLANLVFRLIELPHQAQGWWQDIITLATGELDPCLSAPSITTTAPITFEPGWCIGVGDNRRGRGDDANDGSDGGGSDGGGSYGVQSMGAVFADSAGAMGIPIPAVAQAASSQLVADTFDPFEVNPVVKQHYQKNFVDRAITRLVSDSTLSETGQALLKDHTDSAMELALSSQILAGKGQSMDVTQDVVKQKMSIESEQSLLLGGVVSQLAQGRIDSALTNRNLANISRTMDEVAKQKRIERAILARRLLEVSSQVNLY